MNQGLRIVCRDGSALGQDEIDAAHRVVATFGPRFQGVIPIVDVVTGCLVEYHTHKSLAVVDPAGCDYRLATLPCPWPARSAWAIDITHAADNVYWPAEYAVALSDATTVLKIQYDPRYKIAFVGSWVGSPNITLRDKWPPYGPHVVYPFSALPADVLSTGADIDYSRENGPDAQAYRASMLTKRAAWSSGRTADTVAAHFVSDGLWPSWDLALKTNHPASQKLVRVFKPNDEPLTEQVTDTWTVQEADFPTFPDLETANLWRRDYYLHFKLADENGLVTELSESGQGTLTQTRTNIGQFVVTTIDYANFYLPFDANLNGSLMPWLPTPVWVKPEDPGGGPFLPEVSDRYADSMYYFGGIGEFPNTKGTLWNGRTTFVIDRANFLDAALFDNSIDLGDSFSWAAWGGPWATAPYDSQNTLSWALPDVVKEYHRLLTVQGSPTTRPSGESELLFSAPRSAKFVDVILFSQFFNGQNLGMYWQFSWYVDYVRDTFGSLQLMIDGVEVEGILRLKWDDSLLRFVPVSDVLKTDSPIRITFPQPMPRISANAILRFSGLKYRDTKQDAKLLREYLKEDPPAHTYQVSQMLGGQWTGTNWQDTTQAIVAGILSELGDL